MKACTYVRSEIFEDFREKGGWCGINATRLRNSGIEGGANRRNLCTQKRSKGRERERENRDAVKGKVWMDETNGSGSSTKSDSAHRIEVVRGPRRTLIRLTGSFLVLLTPAVARTPSPPQLAYLSSPTVADRPTAAFSSASKC